MSVVAGATIKCTFAVPPGVSTLIAIPKGPPVMMGGPPAATIMDFAPILNVPTFGMCMTPTNPVVATATAAAQGVLTPMPCIPVILAPWAPGNPTVLIGGFPALSKTSVCTCTWGGVISVINPGQITVAGL